MRNETDGEMLLGIAKNFAILFFVIFMFDSILNGLLWLIDAVAELIHIGIEAVEYSIEVLLENIFDTNHFQSEVIIVNSVIILALYVIYRLYFFIPRWIARYNRKLKAAWLRNKRHRSSNWRAMSTTCKIKWVSAYSFGITCLMFLITL